MYMSWRQEGDVEEPTAKRTEEETTVRFSGTGGDAEHFADE